MTKKIAIAYGEIPPDCGPDEQSMLELCNDVATSLEAHGFKPYIQEIKLNLRETTEELREKKPDVVFNLVDTIDGFSTLGHLAPQLFEHLSIPYTGGSAQSIYVTTDKELTKDLLRSHDLPCPQTWNPEVKKGTFLVKSLTEDGSIGIGPENCVKGNEVQKLIAEKTKQYGGIWFAEQYVDGREFNVAILDGKVLPMAEILFENYPEGKPKIVDYASKWLTDSFEYNNTTRRFEFPKKDAALLKRMEEIALKCWEVFHLSGYARVDFRVDEHGDPYVLEVNVNPCLDRDAGFAAAAARAGLSYEHLLHSIVTHVEAR